MRFQGCGQALIGCDSDGDSESIFRDSTFNRESPSTITLASRKRCDLKTRKRCDFYSAAPKIASDFSAISSAIFWRFLCDFCGKTCDLVLCDLKTQRFFCDSDGDSESIFRDSTFNREDPIRFGSVTVRGWNGSSGSGFRFRRFLYKKGFLCFSSV